MQDFTDLEPQNTGPVIVLGAGHAGMQLALALRQGGYIGGLILVDREPHLPYQKPPLSKGFLSGKVGIDALKFKSETFLAEQGITLRQAEVIGIDRSDKALQLNDGSRLHYGHLVLAPGATNRRLGCPGEDLAGVYSLRGLDDAMRLRESLAACRQAIVVGAGFIGLEFGASARQAGLAVHFLDTAQRPMARVISAAMSSACLLTHRGQGLSFSFGVSVAEVVGSEGRVSGVRCASGEYFETDLVLVAIGVVPQTRLAAQAGLEVADGILVDELLRSSDPNISAIGDAASFPYGQDRLRLESVQNALEQARCVAARLIGCAQPYRLQPSFWSDQGAVKLQITGMHDPGDDAVILPSDNPSACSALLFRNGVLCAVESLNRPADQVLAKRILAQGVRPHLDEARTTGFDLSAWAAKALA